MDLLSEKDQEILAKLDKAIQGARKEIGVGRYPEWLDDLNYCYGYFRGRLNLLGSLEEKWNDTQEKT